MHILLTGATGYIGKRLLPSLVAAGHEVTCCVRDKDRFSYGPSIGDHVNVVEIDFLQQDQLNRVPDQIDAAYYLIHSMSAGSEQFQQMEAKTAKHFRMAMNERSVRQVIYLSGIVNAEELSPHLASRKQVERILSEGTFALTTLRAGIIVGSGSASFEIMRDLVEKLPLMIAPRWLNTKTQPIAIRDVISFLTKVLGHQPAYNRSFDIGGPDVLTYQQMLEIFAQVRGLKRWIFTVPVMSPNLSSYWLYFITSTSYPLARNLVNSMKTEVICQPNTLAEQLGIQPITYREAIEYAFDKIEQSNVPSSWKDAMVSGRLNTQLSDYIEVPTHGCFRDVRTYPVDNPEAAFKRFWSIGGENGWYYANWLWKIRGFLDKLVGGVGLRRGRTNDNQINPGDALDFWRVLYANREKKRLLLFAEMKLPGEAWLEFNIEDDMLIQTATFRPKGVWGRFYWYSVFPFHGFVFRGMAKAVAQGQR
ncbi:MAG: SDR family oxidoreductase [Bacteroidota bacterium]